MVCLNPSARSLVHWPESLLSAMRDNLEEDPEFAIPREKLARYFPLALRSARSNRRGAKAVSAGRIRCSCATSVCTSSANLARRRVPTAGKQFCRACQPKCRCGTARHPGK
jgi:hypothetical protein